MESLGLDCGLVCYSPRAFGPGMVGMAWYPFYPLTMAVPTLLVLQQVQAYSHFPMKLKSLLALDVELKAAMSVLGMSEILADEGLV